jgi:hypothetical protein
MGPHSCYHPENSIRSEVMEPVTAVQLRLPGPLRHALGLQEAGWETAVSTSSTPVIRLV